jgi:hypothetical protein
MQLEAQRLSAASFGVTLLQCIGRVYSRQADIFLGGLLGGCLKMRGLYGANQHSYACYFVCHAQVLLLVDA